MRSGRSQLLVLPAVALLLGGCVDWRIEAPHTDIVLTRGKGDIAAQLAQSGAWPRYSQRQVGLVAVGFGSALVPGDEIFPSMQFRRMIDNPVKDAAIVTGWDYVDWIIETFSFNIIKSHRIRIYGDVE